jgi:hypothetical protein
MPAWGARVGRSGGCLADGLTELADREGAIHPAVWLSGAGGNQVASAYHLGKVGQCPS